MRRIGEMPARLGFGGLPACWRQSRVSEKISPLWQFRAASNKSNTSGRDKDKAKKKKKGNTTFKNQQLDPDMQFSLCDAMR